MRVDNPRLAKEGATATFDFDGTIAIQGKGKVKQGERERIPNDYAIGEMFRLATLNWKILIVTERNKTPYAIRVIRHFIDRYGLPVNGIIHTGGYEKFAVLENIPSVIHFDDDPMEIALLPPSITGVLIRRYVKKEKKQKPLPMCPAELVSYHKHYLALAKGEIEEPLAML